MTRHEKELARMIADSAFRGEQHPSETSKALAATDSQDLGIAVDVPGAMGSWLREHVHITPEITAEAVRIWSAPDYNGEF